MMDKPVTLSVKNFLIRKLSSDMIVPEKVIEEIVNHQFVTIVEATKVHHTIEMSGFGKFLFNHKKAQRRMWLYENTKRLYESQLSQDITPVKRRSLEAKLKILLGYIEALKPMLHED